MDRGTVIFYRRVETKSANELRRIQTKSLGDPGAPGGLVTLRCNSSRRKDPSEFLAITMK